MHFKYCPPPVTRQVNRSESNPLIWEYAAGLEKEEKNSKDATAPGSKNKSPF